MSTAEYEAKVQADVARVADACEKSNEQTDELVSIAHERLMRDYGVPVEELRRQQRHHDVLCLVLKNLTSRDVFILADVVDLARSTADLAYPPPKAEP